MTSFEVEATWPCALTATPLETGETQLDWSVTTDLPAGSGYGVSITDGGVIYSSGGLSCSQPGTTTTGNVGPFTLTANRSGEVKCSATA
jgi:hypothetical protein